jgi:hypothetical protein
MDSEENLNQYNSFEFSSDLLRQITQDGYCGCCKGSRDCKNIAFIQKWLYAHATSLSDDDRELIIMRYSQCILRIRKKLLSAQRAHTSTTLFTGVASILVTSFISINNINTNATVNESSVLWWTSWSLSLAISIANSMSAFYKWERKYLMLFNIYNALEREVFLFLEGVTPYCTIDDNCIVPSCHKDHLKQFLYKLESLNKKLNDSLLDIEQEDQNDSSLSSTPKKTTKTPIMLSPINRRFVVNSVSLNNFDKFEMKNENTTSVPLNNFDKIEMKNENIATSMNTVNTVDTTSNTMPPTKMVDI